MGRTIPSATFRVDDKVERWKKLYSALSSRERTSFDQLLSFGKRLRNTMAETDEEISILMLLSMLIDVKTELNELKVMEVQRKLEDGTVGQTD